jgi:hypothetical protein
MAKLGGAETIQNKGKQREPVHPAYLLFAQKVPDLDAVVLAGDGSVDGKMGVHKSHLVPVSPGDAGDEVLHVTDCRADSGNGLSGPKPSINLQLSAILDHLKIQVEMLKIPLQLPTGPCYANLLRLDFQLDRVGNVHSLGCQDNLHLGCLSLCPSREIISNQP